MSTIDQIQHFKGLARVRLAMTRKRAFPIVFFDKGVFQQSGIARYRGEPVIVRGRVERYEKGSYSTLQIVAHEPKQITLPALPSQD